MTSKTRPYREALLEALSDPSEAVHYLNAAINDSPEMFLKALRNVAQAHQMAKVARDAGVTRESLYRATSEIGNPTLDTLDSVLSAVGVRMQFAVHVVGSSAAPSTASAISHHGSSANARASGAGGDDLLQTSGLVNYGTLNVGAPIQVIGSAGLISSQSALSASGGHTFITGASCINQSVPVFGFNPEPAAPPLAFVIPPPQQESTEAILIMPR